MLGRDFAGKWRRGLDLKNAAILGDVDLSGVQCPADQLERPNPARSPHQEERLWKRAAATHLPWLD